jgi:hypothetical protein
MAAPAYASRRREPRRELMSENAAEILRFTPGPQPFESGAASRYPAGSEAETLESVLGAAIAGAFGDDFALSLIVGLGLLQGGDLSLGEE